MRAGGDQCALAEGEGRWRRAPCGAVEGVVNLPPFSGSKQRSRGGDAFAVGQAADGPFIGLGRGMSGAPAPPRAEGH